MSFPFHKDQLLSPLSDDLIQFGKKEKIMKDYGYFSVNKSDSKGKHDILGVSDAQKRAGKYSTAKKEKLKERVKYMPPSNRLDVNHSVFNTEKDADEKSCEELVSKTLKLPLLSCLSPSYIHPAKEIDRISDSYAEDVEGTLKVPSNTDLDAALMGSKPELEDNVVAFPDLSVKETESVDRRKDVYLTEGEALVSLESKSKRENAPSKTRNEEQVLKSKRPKAQKSQKSSGSIVAMNSLRGKDDTVNVINTNVPDKLQEDIGGSEDVYEGFFGDSGESKEKVLKAKKEKVPKVSEENALKESVNSVKKDEEACIKSSDLNEDRHNTKQSVTWEVKDKHSVEGNICEIY